ncbi:MAG: SDR family oxidoreductase [Desulfomonilia bacterium]|jgi:NAD(P)-dependent dehydrogenase (short-subunit alcohol dehydrogenase family)
MKTLSGKVCALTGAASGIGRCLALKLADEGCALALADIDEKGLGETAVQIGSKVRVSTHKVDVSDRVQVRTFAADAVKYHGCVDLVINNAGVCVADLIETISYEDFEWIMGINFWGVVYGTKEFLPYLKQRPEAHIINVSSINGIVPSPNESSYNASKFAVKGFTETLYQEFRKTNIRVSCVHPGWIKTNIAKNARWGHLIVSGLSPEKACDILDKQVFRTFPDNAADTIISGIKRNDRRIIVCPEAKALDYVARAFPRTAVTLLAWSFEFLIRHGKG